MSSQQAKRRVPTLIIRIHVMSPERDNTCYSPGCSATTRPGISWTVEFKRTTNRTTKEPNVFESSQCGWGHIKLRVCFGRSSPKLEKSNDRFFSLSRSLTKTWDRGDWEGHFYYLKRQCHILWFYRLFYKLTSLFVCPVYCRLLTT